MLRTFASNRKEGNVDETQKISVFLFLDGHGVCPFQAETPGWYRATAPNPPSSASSSISIVPQGLAGTNDWSHVLLRRGGAGYRILREVHFLETASRRLFPIRVGVRPLLHFLLYLLTYFALPMKIPLTSTTSCTSPPFSMPPR